MFRESIQNFISFCADDGKIIEDQLPATWDHSTDSTYRFLLKTETKEYKSISKDFDRAMNTHYSRIVKIERIQNERWYSQFLAHGREFKKRLKHNTEKRLYHGCPESATNSIIKGLFQ